MSPGGVKRLADLGGSGDQPEGDQAAADRAEEHGRPAGSLGDRRRAGPLEGELLGRHERDRSWRRIDAGLIGLLARFSVAHDHAPIPRS
jgi:hypothetical protein